MASITIHNLDERLAARLRERAARNGRTVEDEAGRILQEALAFDSTRQTGAALVADIRQRVEPFGGVELELPLRHQTRC